MAIDTLQKRAASLTYGSHARAGIRPPTGTTSKFLRAATLGLYYNDPPVVVVSDASCGWRFGNSDVVFTFSDMNCR